MKKIPLNNNEETVAIIRPALSGYFWEIIGAAIFIITPSYFAFWLFAQGRYGQAAFGFSLLIGILLIMKIIVSRVRNYTVVTSRRVIHLASSNFFDEEMLDIGLYEIQNIFFFKKGLSAKIFNFGELSLENNQRQELLRLKRVSYPEKMFHVLNKLKNDFWLDKKDLDTDGIIDMFIDNLSLIDTEDLREIKTCVEDVLRNREAKK